MPEQSILSTGKAVTPPDITNLEQLLDRIGEPRTGGDRVSLGMLVASAGSRSFGSLLLLAGVILISPLSGIPGVPTTMGLFILLVALQMLLHRRHLWLPRWLLERAVSRRRLARAIGLLRRPAAWVDRWMRPRLHVFVDGPGVYLLAIACMVIAAGMPVMEVLPFSATTAGIPIAAFGLAMIAHDGLLAAAALALSVAAAVLLTYNLV